MNTLVGDADRCKCPFGRFLPLSCGCFDAYSRHIQIGLIVQGLLHHHLAVNHLRLVWSSFGSWLRTIRPGIPPSELVTSIALRNSFPDFLAHSQDIPLFKKFIRERVEPERAQVLRLPA